MMYFLPFFILFPQFHSLLYVIFCEMAQCQEETGTWLFRPPLLFILFTFTVLFLTAAPLSGVH